MIISSCLLSLCMIVRNEEETISSCLDSIQDIVDEIVIVDTGSEDQTLKIVKRYGADIYTSSWQDDFSIARNFALSKARGRWILFLDADESLDRLAVQTLRKTLTTADAEGFYLTIYNYQDSKSNYIKTYALRLFRHNPLYRYEGKIHEQIFPSIQKTSPQARIAWSPWIIHHFGYSKSVVKSKEKAKRNLTILLSETTEIKESPFYNFNLAMEYLRLGNILEAEVILKEGWRRVNVYESYAHRLLTKLIDCLHRQRNYAEALLYCSKGLKLYPDYADIYYYYGLCLMNTGNLEEARNILLRGLHQGESPSKYVSQAGCGSYLNILALGQIEEQDTNFGLALDYYLQALRLQPYNLSILKSFLRVLLKSDFDKKAYLVEHNFLNGYLSTIIRTLYSSDNYYLLLDILSDYQESNDWELQLIRGKSHMRLGNYQQALDCLDEIPLQEKNLRQDGLFYSWMCTILEKEYLLAQKYLDMLKTYNSKLSKLLVKIQVILQDGLLTDGVINFKEFADTESVLTILTIIDNFAVRKKMDLLNPVIGVLFHISGEHFKPLILEILDKRQCYNREVPSVW